MSLESSVSLPEALTGPSLAHLGTHSPPAQVRDTGHSRAPYRGILGLGWPRDHEYLGYGTLGRNLELGLEALGVELLAGETIHDYPNPREGVSTMLWAAQPGHPRGHYKGQRACLLTMWEATRLPPGFSSTLWNFDIVMVPCDQNMELFSKQPIEYLAKCPLGYNSTVWKPLDREEVGAEFRFLFCGAGVALKTRKGSDQAIDAFLKAFPDWKKLEPRPKLVIKSLGALAQTNEPLSHVNLDGPEFIELHRGAWPVEKLVELYRSCHVMVLPSRGEGWGYHPQQALATGIPTIVSAIPAHNEYAWIDGFTTIPVHEAPAGKFLHGDGGMWWDCDVSALADAMRDHYETYEEHVKKAKIGSVSIRENYNHVAMAAKVLQILGPEYLTKTKTGDFIKHQEAEYRLITTRDFGPGECDVAGKTYFFKAGQEYWVPQNVRGVMENAGFCANVSDDVSRIPV